MRSVNNTDAIGAPAEVDEPVSSGASVTALTGTPSSPRTGEPSSFNSATVIPVKRSSEPAVEYEPSESR